MATETTQSAKAATADLPAAIFDVQTNVPLIHQVVVAQLAAARQGTHATKTRGEVRGGGRKPYRQKGTGRARQGSTRAPQFTGGGIVHGPQPRDYAQRTPKKMKAAALRGALSDRARHGRVHVVDSLTTGEVPSTKSAQARLAGLTERPNLLVVLERADIVSMKSVRNLSNVHVLAVDQLNTYDVLCADDVVFTRGALDSLTSGPVGSGSTGSGSASTGSASTGSASSGSTDAESHPFDAASIDSTDAESTDAESTSTGSPTSGSTDAPAEASEPAALASTPVTETAAAADDTADADDTAASDDAADADDTAAAGDATPTKHTLVDYGPQSRVAVAGETAPEGYAIKGNADSMKYHVPGSRWYDVTEAEVWFSSADAARAAGFDPAGGEAAQQTDQEAAR